MGDPPQSAWAANAAAQVVRGRHRARKSSSNRSIARACAALDSVSHAVARCWASGVGLPGRIAVTLNTEVPYLVSACNGALKTAFLDALRQHAGLDRPRRPAAFDGKASRGAAPS